MDDIDYARETIRRLNELLKHDISVRIAIDTLIKQRIPVAQAIIDHPTIQCGKHGSEWKVGMLGILNGITGVKDDKRGYIAAVYDDETHELKNFELILAVAGDNNCAIVECDVDDFVGDDV